MINLFGSLHYETFCLSFHNIVMLILDHLLLRTVLKYWQSWILYNLFSSYTARRCVCIYTFISCRQDFVTFLNRPDHKQQFVSQWQKVCMQPLPVWERSLLIVHRRCWEDACGGFYGCIFGNCNIIQVRQMLAYCDIHIITYLLSYLLWCRIC